MNLCFGAGGKGSFINGLRFLSKGIHDIIYTHNNDKAEKQTDKMCIGCWTKVLSVE